MSPIICYSYDSGLKIDGILHKLSLILIYFLIYPNEALPLHHNTDQ